jgi:MSHA biogenesis protein MshJ
MDSLKRSWQAWSMRIDALSFRERILVFLAVAGVALSLMFVGLIEPALKRQEQMLSSATGLQQEIFTLREQLATSEQLDQGGINTELGRLRAEAEALEKLLKARESGLIEPARMMAMLKTLLAEQAGLTLIALEAEPGQPVLLVKAEEEAQAEPAPAELKPPSAQLFYKHGVTLRLQGSYAQLTDYVARIEAQPWTVQWESARLDARRHPQLELTLKLNTLSREPTWARL